MTGREQAVGQDARMTAHELSQLAACPVCRTALVLPEGATGVTCSSCESVFEALPFAWNLTPAPEHLVPAAWETWDALQANGVVAYEADPSNNLGVGERSDYGQFSDFAALEGTVLDIGCGPQVWPAHFTPNAERCRFVGIDPLVGERRAGYTQVRGVAEHLPFRDGAFAHAIFCTTLDHFVDPALALREALRVVGDGDVDVWLGHKDPRAPRPASSPEWYERLAEPAGADDLFHIKRMDDADARALFEVAGLEIAREQALRVDEFRTNHFYKLRGS